MNDAMTLWTADNNTNKAAHEVVLQAIADEVAPKRPSQIGRVLAFLAVCGACFVPAATIGYANGGFDEVQAMSVPTRIQDPAPAPKPPRTVVLDEDVITSDALVKTAPKAKRSPRRAAKRAPRPCFDHVLRMGGSPNHPTVRVCGL